MLLVARSQQQLTVACDDDNSANGLMPYLYLTGLASGQTVYIRVWEYGAGTTGTFGILANSPVSLPVELLYFALDSMTSL